MNLIFNPQKGFYREIFLNLMLILVTFGLYLPWGLTNVRRLVWSNMYLGEQRFYYLGNSKEIVKGCIALLFIYFLTRVFEIFGDQYSNNEYLSFLFSLPGLIIFFTLLYKAQLGSFRYQARRTAYRGIRFQTIRTCVHKEYFDCLRMGALTVFSAGLMYVYFYFRNEKLKLRALWYGDQNFSYDLTFKRYAWEILKHLLVFIFIGLLIGLAYKTLESHIDQVFNSLLIIGLGVVSVCVVFLHLIWSIFHLKIRHFKSQNLSFSSSLDFKTYLRANLVHIPLLIMTFGVAIPLVMARNIALYANGLNVNGLECLSSYGNSEAERSFDEVLSQSFDLDVLDVF